MIVDMLDTSTTAINDKLNELRRRVGAVTRGRVMTLIIAPDSDARLDESIDAANFASHEHPSRIIVVMTEASGALRRDLTHSYAPAVTPAPERLWCCGFPARFPCTPTAWSCRLCCPTPR